MKTILTLIFGLFALAATAQTEMDAKKYLEAINCAEYTCVEKILTPLGYTTKKSYSGYSFKKPNTDTGKDDTFMYDVKFGVTSLSYGTYSKILHDGMVKQLTDLGFKQVTKNYENSAYGTVNFSLSSVDTGSGTMYMILMDRK